jgi:hypothetical protein
MVEVPAAAFGHMVTPDQVHKESASEAFPTLVSSVGEHELWAEVRWPTNHAFYKDASSGLDSFMLMETVRQLTILACHYHYGTATEAHFVMSGLGLALFPLAIPEETRPTNVSARLVGTRVRRSADGTLQSVRLEAEFFHQSVPFASGHGDAMIVNERVYSRLRGGRTAKRSDPGRISSVATVAPSQVGHLSGSEVVLSSEHSSDSFTLSLDFSNPVLFDHPLDHIAGMIPVEASRQIMRCLRANPGAELSTAEFHFHRALEFDVEVNVEVSAGDEDGATLQFVQGGRVAVTCAVTVAPVATPPRGPGLGGREAVVRCPAGQPVLPQGRRTSTSREVFAGDLLAL